MIPAIAFHATQDPINGKISPCIGQGSKEGCGSIAVAVDVYNGNVDGDVAATVGAGSGVSNHAGAQVMTKMAVRRLTPVECERLQGFPDGYTAITYNGKLASDGPRYKSLGNSMAVPVMAWIGKRINLFGESNG